MLSLDHIVIGAPDLDTAIQAFSKTYGLEAVQGGAHPDLGTHNALIGAGDTYLELLAPIPGAHCTIPGLAALKEPALYHYALRTSDLEGIETHAAGLGLRSEGIQTGRRKTKDGSLLTWRILHLRGHALGATVPFFIDWQDSPNPATQLAPQVQEVMLKVTGSALLSTLLEGADGVELCEGAAALALTCAAEATVIRLEAPRPLPLGL
ncbi:MAG: VOC family protein [Pseudomonadota bacterium]